MGFLRGGALGLGMSLLAVSAPAQQPSPSPAAASLDTLQQELRRLQGAQASDRHQVGQLMKLVDDALWQLTLQDIASVDKVKLTDKPARTSNPTGQGYREMFAGFIGKQAVDNPAEYRKRSPVNHVSKLETPLARHLK